MKKNYDSTIRACLIGYVVQGIVNNFLPLLFLTFQNTYGLSLTKITLLVTINFTIQLCMDFSSAFFLDRIGYRAAAVMAFSFAAAGMASLAVFPELLPDPFAGLLISVGLYAIGGGLIEVIISPIVEACPSDHKSRTMSLLHSFYCWGSVAVVAISTLFFYTVGIQHWKMIALLWAVVPIVNLIVFLGVPFPSLNGGSKAISIPSLIKNRTFWQFFVIILCAGATEVAVVQWSSAFAEAALGITKTVGDLAGPALFSVFMGLARAVYGKFGGKFGLEKLMILGGILCIVSYLIMALIPVPAAALAGMALSGMAVASLWPGTYSLSAERIKGGGNAMFAFLALAGDFGCVAGPTLIGFVSGAFGDNLKIGILTATIFPLIMTVVLVFGNNRRKRTSKESPQTQEALGTAEHH